MANYKALISSFYDDFPDMRDHVFFRFRHNKSNNVLDDRWAEGIAIEKQKYTDQIGYEPWDQAATFKFPDDYKICQIELDDGPASIARWLETPYQSLSHQTWINYKIFESIEREYLFHHETTHAVKHIRRMNRRNRSFEDVLYEECLADAYAAQKIIQAYGTDGLRFMQMIADARQFETAHTPKKFMGDHMTSFAIDAIIQDIARAGLSTLNGRTAEDCLAIAETYAKKYAFKEADREEIYKTYQSLAKNAEAPENRFSARFNRAVNRIIDEMHIPGMTQEDHVIFNGPWASAPARFVNAGFVTNIAFSDPKPAELEQVKKLVSMYEGEDQPNWIKGRDKIKAYDPYLLYFLDYSRTVKGVDFDSRRNDPILHESLARRYFRSKKEIALFERQHKTFGNINPANTYQE